jgi:hypothetical protein
MAFMRGKEQGKASAGGGRERDIGAWASLLKKENGPGLKKRCRFLNIPKKFKLI